MSAVLIDTSCLIHEIPLSIFRVVCGQLDQNGRWKQLAREFGYDRQNSVIDQITQSTSPASKLLSLWSNQNHTVTELFMILYRLKEFRIMEHLRDLVDSTYHRLIVSSKSSSFASLRAQFNATVKPYKHHKKSSSSFKMDNVKPETNPFDLVCVGIPHIAHGELKQATNGWNKQQVLGSGAFGTVYRGEWKCTDVAIKYIDCQGYDKSSTTKKRLKQMLHEMRFLNAHRHDNILPLYGYSFDGSTACLVYQMMAGGSLDLKLRQTISPLTYEQRVNIAIGTARGLQFLHTFNKRATVHGDIKSANILLDSNLNPKIGDFGLACHTSGYTKSKRLFGTHAYLADDFISNLIISTKNDVWSFGVVLFELATSLRAYDERRGGLSKLSRYIWAYSQTSNNINDLIDKRTISQSEKARPTLRRLIQIGLSCTKPKSIDRPEMTDVLNLLLEI